MNNWATVLKWQHNRNATMSSKTSQGYNSMLHFYYSNFILNCIVTYSKLNDS